MDNVIPLFLNSTTFGLQTLSFNLFWLRVIAFNFFSWIFYNISMALSVIRFWPRFRLTTLASLQASTIACRLSVVSLFLTNLRHLRR